jgi:hypothetical protein
MMTSVAQRAVWAVTLACACAVALRAQATSEPVADPAAYAVYGAMVEPPTGAKANLPVLRLETVTPPASCPALEAAVAPAWKAAARAFVAANGAPRPLLRERVAALPFVPATPAEIDRAVAAGWDRFRTAYKGAGGFVSVSAVGFDPGLTRAIVWVSYACGPKCGSREFRRFVKKGQAWREESSPHGLGC